MSTTGLSVFDKTVQTTNIWLDEVMADVGPDRQVAWHVLSTVLRALRDRVPPDLAAHLGSQLPLLVRGAYYDGFKPSAQPSRIRDQDEFLSDVGQGLTDTRPVNVQDAVSSVFTVLSAHLPRGQCEKVRNALPEPLRAMWRLDDGAADSVVERAAKGRAALQAQEARAWRERETPEKKD